MSAKPEHYRDLTRLISALLDDQLTGEERARLELLLEADPAARRLYFQMVDQEIELDCLFVPAGAERASVPSGATRQNAWSRREWLTLAAAAVVTFLLMLWLKPGLQPERLQVAEAVSTSWAADFEAGSAQGWTGELVSNGLPAGSAHGMRAIAMQIPEGVFYKLAPPEDWRDGFAALTGNSTLHITYRLGSPAWMNVFMHTLGADLANPAMFQLMGSRFPGAAGQWQTASIPFARFQRKVPDDATGALAFVGGGPRDGERIAAFMFSAPHPIDLVIDRIWITPDGTGAESITALQ